MDPVRWNDSYNTGIERIDQQHRRLIDMLNVHLAEGLLDHPLQRATTMLADFQNYAELHFCLEEELAEQAGIHRSTNWLMHAGEHDYYRKRIHELGQLATSKPDESAHQLLSFLRYWWTAHIGGADQRLAENLLRKTPL